MRATSNALFLALALLTSVAAADISVIENDKTLDVDCAKDPNVSLMGNHNTVTLKGTCAKISLFGNHNTLIGSAATVSVAGNHNTVTLDKVDVLSVPGNQNTVTYKGPVTAKATRVSAPGNKNTVTQQK